MLKKSLPIPHFFKENPISSSYFNNKTPGAQDFRLPFFLQ